MLLSTTADLMRACSLEDEMVSGTMSLKVLTDLLADSRPKLLQALKDAGVDKLTDRQAVANALSKAQREGRLRLDMENANQAREVGLVEAPISKKDLQPAAAAPAAPTSEVRSTVIQVDPMAKTEVKSNAAAPASQMHSTEMIVDSMSLMKLMPTPPTTVEDTTTQTDSSRLRWLCKCRSPSPSSEPCRLQRCPSTRVAC